MNPHSLATRKKWRSYIQTQLCNVMNEGTSECGTTCVARVREWRDRTKEALLRFSPIPEN